MVVKVKVIPKDNGDEPKVAQDQAAPIDGADDLPWHEETVNGEHADLPEPPEADVPPPPPEQEVATGVSDSGDLPEPPPQSSEPSGTELDGGHGADGDSKPTEDDGEVGAAPSPDESGVADDLPEPPPTESGKPEASEPESDQPPTPEQTVEEAAEETFETVDNGTVTTDTEMKSHGETVSTHHESEKVGQPVTGQVARVSYACGFTKNIGEFNSMRAEVKIELPCAVEDVEQTYDQAVSFVDARLQKLWDDA